MTVGYYHAPDGEGPGMVTLANGTREIRLRGAEAAAARKQHENFVARYGHDSFEERTWIDTMILTEMMTD